MDMMIQWASSKSLFLISQKQNWLKKPRKLKSFKKKGDKNLWSKRSWISGIIATSTSRRVMIKRHLMDSRLHRKIANLPIWVKYSMMYALIWNLLGSTCLLTLLVITFNVFPYRTGRMSSFLFSQLATKSLKNLKIFREVLWKTVINRVKKTMTYESKQKASVKKQLSKTNTLSFLCGSTIKRLSLALVHSLRLPLYRLSMPVWRKRSKPTLLLAATANYTTSATAAQISEAVGTRLYICVRFSVMRS